MVQSHVNEFSSSGSSPTRVRKKPAAPVSPISSAPIPPPFRSRRALTTPEAALYAGVTPFFIEELTRGGEIPFRELALADGTISGKGRVYDADDLDAWIVRQPKLRITKIIGGKAIMEGAA
jgi:hypothetical protein